MWNKKKYTSVDIDAPNDNVEIYPQVRSPTAKTSSRNDFSKKQKVIDRLNAAREKKSRKQEDKKWVLIIKDYMAYLHRRSAAPIDVHHWMPKSRIKRNDYFVCCIPPSEHYQIHHGGGSVNGFIEEKGIENLLIDSAIMFAEWLATDAARRHRNYERYVAMIKEIQTSPADFNFVLKTTRECAEDIRQGKGKL